MPELIAPLCLHIESISSKTITCKPESSPFCFWSSSAFWKSSRILRSVSPTNLSKSSGPFTILHSSAFRHFASVLAIRVFPFFCFFLTFFFCIFFEFYKNFY